MRAPQCQKDTPIEPGQRGVDLGLRRPGDGHTRQHDLTIRLLRSLYPQEMAAARATLDSPAVLNDL